MRPDFEETASGAPYSCIFARSSNKLKYVISDEIYERGLKKVPRERLRSGNTRDAQYICTVYDINISSGGRGRARLVTLTQIVMCHTCSNALYIR